jgi:hypothetical protein
MSYTIEEVPLDGCTITVIADFNIGEDCEVEDLKIEKVCLDDSFCNEQYFKIDHFIECYQKAIKQAVEDFLDTDKGENFIQSILDAREEYFDEDLDNWPSSAESSRMDCGITGYCSI